MIKRFEVMRAGRIGFRMVGIASEGACDPRIRNGNVPLGLLHGRPHKLGRIVLFDPL
jgi:hypothetical protein